MATDTSNAHTLQGDFALSVKVALLKRRLTVTRLASELGLARNTVSIAINHPSMLPTVKTRVRKHLKIA